MTRKILYVLNIPAGSQTLTRKQLKSNVSKEGVLAGGTASVESVSVQPGDRVLQGEYRGDMADVMAREVEELFGCGAIKYVPMFGLDADGNRVQTEDDGYYALENVSSEPADPRDDSQGHYKFDGALVDKGTKRDYWRAVSTAPKQVDNDFGNGTTGYIGIPSTASKLRWYDAAGGTGTRESASVVTTRDTEFGTVDIIDANAASFDDPTAIYEIPYEAEGRIDTKIWDDRGLGKTTTVGGDTVCQWARVFDTAHEFEGVPVVENAIARLAFDEAAGELSAWRWSEGSGSYESVALGTSDWELFDFDAFAAGDEKVRAQVEFHNPNASGSDRAYFSLNMALRRGYLNPQWVVPVNEQGPTPSGLKTLLDPVGDGSVVSPDEIKTLVERSEVRR